MCIPTLKKIFIKVLHFIKIPRFKDWNETEKNETRKNKTGHENARLR